MQTYIKFTLHFPGKSFKNIMFQDKILFFSENDVSFLQKIMIREFPQVNLWDQVGDPHFFHFWHVTA